MKATILALAIILTKSHRGVVSMHGQGVFCGMSTASEAFVIFSTQLHSCYAIIMP